MGDGGWKMGGLMGGVEMSGKDVINGQLDWRSLSD